MKPTPKRREFDAKMNTLMGVAVGWYKAHDAMCAPIQVSTQVAFPATGKPAEVVTTLPVTRQGKYVSVLLHNGHCAVLSQPKRTVIIDLQRGYAKSIIFRRLGETDGQFRKRFVSAFTLHTAYVSTEDVPAKLTELAVLAGVG